MQYKSCLSQYLALALALVCLAVLAPLPANAHHNPGHTKGGGGGGNDDNGGDGGANRGLVTCSSVIVYPFEKDNLELEAKSKNEDINHQDTDVDADVPGELGAQYWPAGGNTRTADVYLAGEFVGTMRFTPDKDDYTGSLDNIYSPWGVAGDEVKLVFPGQVTDYAEISCILN